MLVGEIIGKGNTAEVYERKDQHQKVIKLFFEEIPFELIEKEFETSKWIYESGIPSPDAEALLKVGKRWGIVFEKIAGKSFTALLTSPTMGIKQGALLFADIQAAFHRKSTDALLAQKEHLSRNISSASLLRKEEKEEILLFLKQLPEDNKVCHGDYHPDNIMLRNGEHKILDWMTGTSGNPCGDIARTIMILKYSFLPEDMPKKTKLSIQSIREQFAELYVNSYIKLTNTSLDMIGKWLLPVMAARLVEAIPEQEKQFLLEKIRGRLLTV
jgi:uncharacterized protein (TIGR02172 family)